MISTCFLVESDDLWQRTTSLTGCVCLSKMEINVKILRHVVIKHRPTKLTTYMHMRGVTSTAAIELVTLRGKHASVDSYMYASYM